MFVLVAPDYQVLYMQQVEINNVNEDRIRELTAELESCKLAEDETGKTTGLPATTVPDVVESTGTMEL